MELRELQKNWNEFGRVDPFWSVLTVPQFKNNRWDPAEFFATGEAEVRAVLEQVDSLGMRTSRWRALDFGCAMGRLTQALCRRFHFCVGVDIAPSMIELANHYNNYPGRCFYVQNSSDSLPFLDDNSFDFVFTKIVLQHIRPPQNRRFIAELTRVIDRGGALVFQIPSKPAPADARLHTASGPLPRMGHNAAIQAQDPPKIAQAGKAMELTVRVRNLSRATWPSRSAANGCSFVQLGNHWLKQEGEMAIPDDGRAMLPHDLHGGEEAVVTLAFRAPSVPGSYWLELDMVEEGVTWFRHRGSKTCRLPVRVSPSEKGSAGRTNPVMEMHGIAKEEVVRIIELAGGKVVTVHEDFSAGGWESYLYFATKE